MSDGTTLDTSIWKEMEEFFSDDGGLQDIFCLDCSHTDLLTLLRFFTSGRFRIVVRDGKRDEVSLQDYPKNIAAYFTDVNDTYLMTVFVGECALNFWLYSGNGYVELDLDSRCILHEREFIIICEFMKAIGDLISKKVNFTREGAPSAIFHYDPAVQNMFPGGEKRE